MTLTNPPFVLQGSSHGAQLFREALGSLLVPAGGIVQAGDLALSQNGSPNMSVNVAAGRIWIPGTSLATVNPGGGAYYPQGSYYAENDATVNLGVSASDPAKPRIDTVIVQVQDAAYVGVTNSAAPAVVIGTPTTGATLGNLTGKGAVPVSSLVIGYVLVPANATTILTADLSAPAPVGLLQVVNALQAANNLSDLANITSARRNLGVLVGSVAVAFSASALSGTVNITHNLGRVPQVMLATINDSDPGATITPFIQSTGSVSIATIQARAATAISATVTFGWIVAG